MYDLNKICKENDLNYKEQNLLQYLTSKRSEFNKKVSSLKFYDVLGNDYLLLSYNYVYNSSILIFKESLISQNEFFMDNIEEIQFNKCYWKNRNLNIINDISDIISLIKKKIYITK